MTFRDDEAAASAAPAIPLAVVNVEGIFRSDLLDSPELMQRHANVKLHQVAFAIVASVDCLVRSEVYDLQSTVAIVLSTRNGIVVHFVFKISR